MKVARVLGRMYVTDMRAFSLFLAGMIFGIAGCSDSLESSPVPDNEPVQDSVFVRTAPVLFTEIAPQNLDFEDEDGDKSDWIEIFNPADTAVNLAGFSFSNSISEPKKWTFGNVEIAPQQFLIVYFSGKDRADFVLPSDSTSMIGSGAWSWSDAEQSDPAGTSEAKPWAFSGYVREIDGNRVLSGQMQLGKNEELGWSSACIFVGTGSGASSDTRDLGTANQLLLTGYLTQGEPLNVRLTQPDIDDWKSWGADITGTGDSTTTYRINLPAGTKFPDLANIYGTRLAAVSGNYNLVQFKFTSIIARNQGHFPHTNFKLPKSGGEIFLFDSAGILCDSIAYPKVPTGKSYSFAANGWGLSDPSPMGFGGNVLSGQASLNLKLPQSGFYSAPFSVTISGDGKSVVRCETGGKAPTESSPIISGSLTISTTTVLRCAAFRDGFLPGDVLTRTYVFEPAPSIATAFITADPNQLFDPDSGIYEEGPEANAVEPHYGANYWKDKTIPAEIAFFEPGRNAPAFESPAGYEIFGNYSRANAKKSFALKFRKKYGNSKLEYKIFPDYPKLKSFKDLVFRNNGGNFGQDYIRDRLSSGISRGLGVDFQKGRFAIVFYNGEYFGIHSIRERSNENYFATNYDLDENSIDLLKADNSASAGSSAEYVSLENYVQTNNMSDSLAYAYVASQMDVDNFISYLQTEIFVANQDWPGNNLKKWRSTSPQTKWKWFLYDLDWGFDNGHSLYSDIDMLHFITDSTATGYPNGTEYTILVRNLLKNEKFRNRFINRFCALVATKFSADSVLPQIQTMMDEIAPEITRDQARWNLDASRMESSLETIREFAQARPSKVIAEMQSFFGLGAVQSVGVIANGCGTIAVDGIEVRSAEISLFAGIPVTLKAIDGPGCSFRNWSDGSTSPIRTIVPGNGDSYTANF